MFIYLFASCILLKLFGLDKSTFLWGFEEKWKRSQNFYVPFLPTCTHIKFIFTLSSVIKWEILCKSIFKMYRWGLYDRHKFLYLDGLWKTLIKILLLSSLMETEKFLEFGWDIVVNAWSSQIHEKYWVRSRVEKAVFASRSLVSFHLWFRYSRRKE